jgi:hypothetical protein
MKISKIQKGLVLLTVAAGMFAVGCELIVDFDRTKIPVEVSEASIPDANVPDTAIPAEGGAEAGPDAEADADAGEITDAADAADADTDQ